MVDYDPFGEDIIQGDPYPVYERLRDESPVHFLEKWDTWVLSRFQDIWDACMDTESFIASQGTTPGHLLTRVQPVTPTLNTIDPPEHTRLRAEMRKFFMPSQLAQLESAFEQYVDAAIEEWAENGVCDVVSDFAQPLATRVGCKVAGFPEEDAAFLRGVVDRFMARDPAIEGLTPDGLAALQEMVDYFGELSARRRREPARHDPIGILHEFESKGRKLTDDEVGSHLFLLLVGGTDTFPKVFASLLLRLFQEPEAREQVAATPSLCVAAFNETARIDMPTQFLGRTLARDLELHGQRMRAGQPVLFLYASGNRDAREFDRPDRFDVHRKPPRTLSFGHGIHACIGLHVARLEGRIALRKLLERFPRYEIETDRLERYATEFVQGYSSMPIRWTI
jgi:cytochrome P450